MPYINIINFDIGCIMKNSSKYANLSNSSYYSSRLDLKEEAGFIQVRFKGRGRGHPG